MSKGKSGKNKKKIETKAPEKPEVKKEKKQPEAAAIAIELSAPEPTEDGKCSACSGTLIDHDDYVFHQRLKSAAACIPFAIGICVAWALLYGLIRVGIGGKLFSGGGAGFAMLVGQKLLVGIVLGAILGAVAGIWRTDIGLFIGVVVGALGGFFVAAAPSMPLLSDASHRLDVVLAALIGGILSGATVLLAHARGTTSFAKFIGPEPRESQK